MTTISNETPLYASRFAGYGYDALSRLVFAPVGGLDLLRHQALDAAALPPGARVLELGCGTGGFTRRLVERGARITAVDRAPSMIVRARQTAPAAAFVDGEITDYRPEPATFDAVWCAFVLHELPHEARQRALAVAHQALTVGGSLVIVEHALPTAGILPRAVSRFVHAFEPAPIVEWLRGGFTAELLEAGFAVRSRRELARGTAVVLCCTRADACSPRPG